MTKKEIKKLINVVIKQSTKKDLEIFLKQIQEMLVIPVQNVLKLNKKELKEIEQNILTTLKN